MPKPDLRMFLPQRVPFWLTATVVVLAIAALVPPVLALRYSQLYKDRPAIHLFLDMDNQPRLKAQDASAVFADGRAMRPPVAGTVARGQLDIDDHYYRGFKPVVNADGTTGVEYLPGFPSQVTVDVGFIQRGREIYDSKCYPCHGKAGYGDGPVNKRAMELQTTGNQSLKLGTVWTTAQNLQKLDENTGQLAYGEAAYPNGELYNVITHGKASMAGYGDKIAVKDRWAVVAYVRALQLSQHAEQSSVVSRQSSEQTTEALAQTTTPPAPAGTTSTR